MTKLYKKLIFSGLLCCFGCLVATAQVTVRGKVLDADTGEELIGATLGTTDGKTGTVTNYEGDYVLKIAALPVEVKVSYTGYDDQIVKISSPDERLQIKMKTRTIVIGEGAVVVGQRIDEKQKTAPLSVEQLDAIAIKQTPSISFYNGLGNLKGVDLTTASLGFTVINMRGFNSTSPVRSLQIIDGVDNQAPGLNFSLGNFLGCSELDAGGVELVAGASGPFYGPNAFNGVISIRSKNPFVLKGLSASVKAGERDLFEGAIRWADAFKNKSGNDVFAYKLNFYHLRAYDWVADNYDAVSGTTAGKYFTADENPGRNDAVNRYGDEYFAGNDETGTVPWDSKHGLQIFHRSGYNEVDLVDYNTRNYKANAAFHYRLQPSKDFESPELILSSSFGSGTTVYQGDNRFSLRNILFFQNRLELTKKDDYFIRVYATNEDAGDSYDPYFTALKMQDFAKSNNAWSGDYKVFWEKQNFAKRMHQLGYPKLETIIIPDPPYFQTKFDQAAAEKWFQDYRDTLAAWHAITLAYANTKTGDSNTGFLTPGTPEFQKKFNEVVSTKSGASGGTRFFDKSALYHAHAEKRFAPRWANYWVLGGNVRFYRPVSEGTIFSDTVIQRTFNSSGVAIDSVYRKITNNEFGFYTGAEKKIFNDKFIVTGTVRVDKNQNFNLLATPAASLVYTPNKVNFLRFSFSSAIRNPTLTDQYLNLNVGRATLVGNLIGFDSLITIPSLFDALSSGLGIDVTKLKFYNAPPIRPEKVKTFELGYRTTLWNKMYMDAGYYFNIYNDFIGYNIGATAAVSATNIDLRTLKVYRVSANSTNQVTTQGFNIGLNYYFNTYYQLSGNYSWNKLNVLDVDDPIIPAFNTPEHKFNIGFSGRDIRMLGLKKSGFNITYKWIEGFVFEGSPQFTGDIPNYDMVDAQWNTTFDRQHLTLKIGATNLFGIAPLFNETAEGESKFKAAFNNRQFQTYGGPRIGRMAYVSLVYDFTKK